MKPLAIITGVGPGTGSAMVRRFAAGGYQVAMIARDVARLDALAAELPDAFAVPCDVTDTPALLAALEAIKARAGVPAVVIHNAVGGSFSNFMDVSPETLQTNFDINVMALFHLAQWAAPMMVAQGHGAIMVTGNTAAQRGRAMFAGFAPTKAAARILSESLARDLGPKGVHVSYLVIDAVIDVPWARERFADAPDEFFIKPSAIADEIWHLTHQDRSAWSFLAEVRPYRENW